MATKSGASIRTFLIWRRLVALRSASAVIHVMATRFGVVIAGTIGSHKYVSFEQFNSFKDAKVRRDSVNKDRVALVVSIEETLFPQGITSATYEPERISSVPQGTHLNPSTASTNRRPMLQ